MYSARLVWGISVTTLAGQHTYMHPFLWSDLLWVALGVPLSCGNPFVLGSRSAWSSTQHALYRKGDGVEFRSEIGDTWNYATIAKIHPDGTLELSDPFAQVLSFPQQAMLLRPRTCATEFSAPLACQWCRGGCELHTLLMGMSGYRDGADYVDLSPTQVMTPPESSEAECISLPTSPMTDLFRADDKRSAWPCSPQADVMGYAAGFADVSDQVHQNGRERSRSAQRMR